MAETMKLSDALRERAATISTSDVETRRLLKTAAESIDLQARPIPIRLNCPSCGELHIDDGEFATKPHHTHACQTCGMTWRPAIVATVGVDFLPGFKNPS